MQRYEVGLVLGRNGDAQLVCSSLVSFAGFGKGNGWPGLPTVAMNAEQFENGGACGVCISVSSVCGSEDWP